MENVIELKNEIVTSYTNLNYYETITLCDKLLDIDSNSITGLYMKGASLLTLGKIEGAYSFFHLSVDAYTKTDDLDDMDAQCYFNAKEMLEKNKSKCTDGGLDLLVNKSSLQTKSYPEIINDSKNRSVNQYSISLVPLRNALGRLRFKHEKLIEKKSKLEEEISRYDPNSFFGSVMQKTIAKSIEKVDVDLYKIITTSLDYIYIYTKEKGGILDRELQRSEEYLIEMLACLKDTHQGSTDLNTKMNEAEFYYGRLKSCGIHDETTMFIIEKKYRLEFQKMSREKQKKEREEVELKPVICYQYKLVEELSSRSAMLDRARIKSGAIIAIKRIRYDIRSLDEDFRQLYSIFGINVLNPPRQWDVTKAFEELVRNSGGN